MIKGGFIRLVKNCTVALTDKVVSLEEEMCHSSDSFFDKRLSRNSTVVQCSHLHLHEERDTASINNGALFIPPSFGSSILPHRKQSNSCEPGHYIQIRR